MLARARNLFVTTLAIAASLCTGDPASLSPKPKLVVAIIIDQFRYDYLTRFRTDYHGGLDRMLTRGAVFTNAFYQHVPTVTAVGHSLFLSGAMPSVSGIVGNSWYDRDEQKVVTSVCDWTEKIVGGEQPSMGKACTDNDPASPRRLLVTTLGDELRTANPDSVTVGISFKPRAAVLPSGHRARGAFWFDDASGHFVSSTYYMQQLPPWAESFNASGQPAQYVGRDWDNFPQWEFRGDAKHPYAKLAASPWGNELIESFAESALRGERLGQHSGTDLLTVSFSSNDYVGHRVGPDAPEVRDMSVRTDALLAKLFNAIDHAVGLNNTIVVLSADHGVAAAPSASTDAKAPGGYLKGDTGEIAAAALNAEYHALDLIIPKTGEAGLYFDHEAIKHHKLAIDEVAQSAIESLLAQPELHVARAYTAAQLITGVSGDFVARAATNGFYRRRSPDVLLIFEPGFVPGASGTTHFSPYNYDTHVPVLLMGPGVKAGRFDEPIAPNDIAPTLATMLSVQTPSGSSGRVLTEALIH